MSSLNGQPERPFAEQVEVAMNAASAPSEETHLFAGTAQARVRLQGGFLTRLVLQGPDGPDSLLYCDPDLSILKLPASHAMMPVGPSDGPGGQHGFLRWVRHTPQPASPYNLQGEGVSTLLDVPSPPELQIGRIITLSSTTLNLSLTVANQGPTPLHTSIGEHFYFAMPEDDARDILVDRGEGTVRLDKLIGIKRAKAIDDGEAQFWPEFEGLGTFTLPDGKQRRIATIPIATGRRVEFPNTSPPLGMLLWRRPGKPFVCLEPTLGFVEGDNAGLKISPNSMAGLITSISVSGNTSP